MKNVIIYLLIILVCNRGFSQSRKEIREFKKIYCTVVDSYTSLERLFVLLDSTFNEGISERDAKSYEEYLYPLNKKTKKRHWQVDSSWKPFFERIDNLPARRKFILPELKCTRTLIRVKDSTLHNLMRNPKDDVWKNFYARYRNTRGYIQLSDVIMHKGKAIVELNFFGGLLNGEGRIFLLECKRGKWKIVNRLQLWVS
jgi:hypothetical protein